MNKGNTVGKISSFLKETEKAYIAGFLDGDGSIIGSVEKHREKKFGYRIRVVVKFSQHTDNIDVLQFIQKKIGKGNVIRGKRVSELTIKSQEAVKKLLEILQPYSFIKRAQIKNALALLAIKIITLNSFLRALKRAENISNNNLKSKSRKKVSFQKVREDVSSND